VIVSFIRLFCGPSRASSLRALQLPCTWTTFEFMSPVHPSHSFARRCEKSILQLGADCTRAASRAIAKANGSRPNARVTEEQLQPDRVARLVFNHADRTDSKVAGGSDLLTKKSNSVSRTGRESETAREQRGDQSFDGLRATRRVGGDSFPNSQLNRVRAHTSLEYAVGPQNTADKLRAPGARRRASTPNPSSVSRGVRRGRSSASSACSTAPAMRRHYLEATDAGRRLRRRTSTS
jgi:hypothetical protein